MPISGFSMNVRFNSYPPRFVPLCVLSEGLFMYTTPPPPPSIGDGIVISLSLWKKLSAYPPLA